MKSLLSLLSIAKEEIVYFGFLLASPWLDLENQRVLTERRSIVYVCVCVCIPVPNEAMIRLVFFLSLFIYASIFFCCLSLSDKES